MFDDLYLFVPCIDNSSLYLPTISVIFEEVHLETHISIKVEDIQLCTFNRDEPLDFYRLTEEPYDKSIVRTILRIDLGDFLP